MPRPLPLSRSMDNLWEWGPTQLEDSLQSARKWWVRRIENHRISQESPLNVSFTPRNLASAFPRATKAPFPLLPSEFSPLSGSTHSHYLFITQGPAHIPIFLIFARIQALLSRRAPGAVTDPRIDLPVDTYPFPLQTPPKRSPCLSRSAGTS